MYFTDTSKEILKVVARQGEKEGKRLYLVGGYLRDRMLGRESPDIDLCMERGSLKFGRSLSRRLKCGYVVLDRERGYCRLVKKVGDKSVILDFTDFRGRALKDDLARRDFTINAMAMPLGSSWPGDLIDPFGARRDISRRIIRAVHKDTFDDDPLRMLRAFSFSCVLGFKIDPATLKIIGSKVRKLKDVSQERVRDELFRALGTSCSHRAFLALDKIRILEVVFPEIKFMRGVRQGPYHHLDVWGHSLETLGQLEGLLEEFSGNPDIAPYLAQEISSGRKRSSLLKLGALLHDIGKPRAMRRRQGKLIFHGHEKAGLRFVEDISLRLKLSNLERDTLKKMVFMHLRPGYLGDTPYPTRHARYRYFRDAGDEAVSILLLSLADQRSTCGPLTTRASRLLHEKVCRRLIGEYFAEKKKPVQQRLVDGNDLMKKLSLAPSPVVGKLLAAIQEARALGRINDKAQALALASKLLKRISKDNR